MSLIALNKDGPKRSMPDFANQLSRDEFYSKYVHSILAALPGQDHSITFETSKSLASTDFQTCFELLEETSATDYKRSSKGWSRKDKKAEMRDARMKYLLLHQNSTGSDDPSPLTGEKSLLGFLSFMLDMEDEIDVAYCYEIHLAEGARGRGLGKLLMRTMENIGDAIPMSKAMLTVFTSNVSARAFYESQGYEYYDEELLPPRKKLRTRTIEPPKPSYVILAKDLQRS